MKVDGKAFKKAREEIKKQYQEHNKKNGLKGGKAVGTQRWLAEVSGVKKRTIQYLEAGTASLYVVDVVSIHLRITGRAYILNYGAKVVDVSAPRVVDFRPTLYPKKNENFEESSLLLTIDPLVIQLHENEDEIDLVILREINALLRLESMEIQFQWLYEVTLQPGKDNWLGIDNPVSEQEFIAPHRYRKPIMFKQKSSDSLISWLSFVGTIEKQEKNEIYLDVEVVFQFFRKKLHICLSAEHMREMIKKGRIKRKSSQPHFIQPTTLVPAP